MDDFVVRVKQVAQNPFVPSAAAEDAILLQRGGLGGAYAWTNPGGVVGPLITPLQFQLDSLVSSFAAAADDFTRALQNLTASTVWSFNGRRGNVRLRPDDITALSFASLLSPAFTGVPTVPTPPLGDYGWQIANTSFVGDAIAANTRALLLGHPFVWTFNGRPGNISLLLADVEQALWQGRPTAPPPPESDSSDRIATTRFVTRNLEWFSADIAALRTDVAAELDAIRSGVAVGILEQVAATYAPLASPQLSGFPSAPTQPVGTNNSSIATTAFVMASMAESVAGVASFNGRAGMVVLTAGDVTAAGGAPLASPALTGVPTGPTALPGTVSQQLATTSFVASAVGTKVIVAAMPPSPSVGNLWWDSIGGRLYVWFDDGTSAQWIDATPAGGSAAVMARLEHLERMMRERPQE